MSALSHFLEEEWGTSLCSPIASEGSSLTSSQLWGAHTDHSSADAEVVNATSETALGNTAALDTDRVDQKTSTIVVSGVAAST